MNTKDLQEEYDTETVEGMEAVRDHLEAEAKYAKYKWQGIKKRGIVTVEEIKDAYVEFVKAGKLYRSAERGLAVTRNMEAKDAG